MTMHVFSGEGSSTKANLDANFAELDARNRGMQSDAGGNIGVSVTPSAWVGNRKVLAIGGTTVANVNYAASVGENAYNFYYTAGGTPTYQVTAPAAIYDFNNSVSGGFSWKIAASGTAGATASLATAMVLDASGAFWVGNYNSLTAGGMQIAPNAGATYQQIGHATGTSSGAQFHGYYYNGGLIGSITQNGTTGVTYNITSDHRLKLNQAPLTGSGAFIDALKPKTWTWVQDGSPGAGFIAHEFAEVSPSSVTGTKDAVDENGAPVYQAMQASSAEVMANLVAEIQDLRRRLAAAGL